MNVGAKIEIMAIDGPVGFRAFRTNVDDVEVAAAELKAKGYELTESVDTKTGKAIVVKDPNGLLINITQYIKK